MHVPFVCPYDARGKSWYLGAPQDGSISYRSAEVCIHLTASEAGAAVCTIHLTCTHDHQLLVDFPLPSYAVTATSGFRPSHMRASCVKMYDANAR
jgi:hypothetical protein